MRNAMLCAFICVMLAIGIIGCSTNGNSGGATATNSESVATAVRNTAPVSICPNGGISVDSGIDINGNGLLDTTEVQNTQYVCNGTNATNGTNGLNALVIVTSEPSGTNCPYGGSKVSVGLDSNSNGILDTSEITSSNYICAAALGTPGQNGTNGIDGFNTLMSISSEPAGTNCSSGGIKMISGLDSNRNGMLDVLEVTMSSYICGDTQAPTAPHLTATAVNDCKINLSWTAASDNIAVTGYDIWREHAKIATLDNVTTVFTDSDLVCATQYTYRVDAYDSAGNISAFSNIASETTATIPTPYTFEKLAGPTIWTNLKRTLAVDSQDQVYVTSGSTIFRVNGSGPTIYLSATALATAIGGGADASSLNITSIDTGPDDKLYILERMYRKILVSDGLGSVTVHRDISNIPGFPQLIGVIDYDNILLINLYDGLWFVKGSGNSLLYDDTLVLGGTDCGTEDFAVRYDGYFGYLPGCNGSPMVGGKSDGSGVGTLLTNAVDVGLGSFYNFSAIGRNATGGYVISIDGARIGHVTTAGQLELIHTQPELDVLAQVMGEGTFGFYYSSIAEGPTGNIYVLSPTTLYVAK